VLTPGIEKKSLGSAALSLVTISTGPPVLW